MNARTFTLIASAIVLFHAAVALGILFVTNR